MQEIRDHQRPVCPMCDERMTLIRYIGYYDEFNYWDCWTDNCKMSDLTDELKPDYEGKGMYV